VKETNKAKFFGTLVERLVYGSFKMSAICDVLERVDCALAEAEEKEDE